MNPKLRGIALWLLPLAIVILLSWQILGNTNNNNLATNGSALNTRKTVVTRISYGRFLDYVESGRVSSIDIFEGGRNAVFETTDPEIENGTQKIKVDLPGITPELINKLKTL